MPFEYIVRARGGTNERTVPVSDIIVPALPEIQGSYFKHIWQLSIKELHADLVRLAEELRAGRIPSQDLFVPNYWGAIRGIPRSQREALLEIWYLAHDLGKETLNIDQSRSHDEVRHGVRGMVYRAKTL